IGTPTQLADAGTVASYTGIVHATPAAPQLTSTLIADWTAYQWTRVRCTAGTAIGAVTWVACANPAGVGIGVARTTRWIRPKLTTFPIYELVNPVVGDEIVVESLPTIPAVTLAVDGPLLLPGNPAWDHRQWFISSIDCQNIETAGTALGEISFALIFGSRLAQVRTLPRLFTSLTSLAKAGCFYSQDDSSTAISASVNAEGALYACLFGGGTTTQVATGATQVLSFNSCLGQNCGFTANAYGYFSLADCQAFDLASATSSALNLTANSVANISSFSGANNTGWGVSLYNNATVRITGTNNITGAAGQARLSAAPVVPLTFLQLLQPSDYAQKGITPAMVTGTTTVTVPWYSNTTQRVTVSHAAFAGTPGILSVQQISTTQFTVTSSNALDTSTVNWTISPLGRNIFISTV
ncbi:MAG: hypothetical protein WC565_09690, partial [Parcubacteria group bacterium]